MVRRSRFKACRKCKALNDAKANKCWNCEGNIFTTRWAGFIIIISEDSEVMKMLGTNKVGYYAVKVF